MLESLHHEVIPVGRLRMNWSLTLEVSQVRVSFLLSLLTDMEESYLFLSEQTKHERGISKRSEHKIKSFIILWRFWCNISIKKLLVWDFETAYCLLKTETFIQYYQTLHFAVLRVQLLDGNILCFRLSILVSVRNFNDIQSYRMENVKLT